MTAEAGQRGGPIAWASDGAGLLVAVNSGAIPARSDRSELWTVDLATAATQLLFTTGNGESWQPLAWDRAARVAGAALEESGFLDDYAVIRLDRDRPALSTLTMRSFQMVITRVHASPDGRYVAGVRDGNTVMWWPLADPARRAELQRERHASGLAWRPGTSQLGWVGGPIPRDCTFICGGGQLVLHDVASGARNTPWPAPTFHLSAFRIDGSAAFFGSANTPDLKALDLASGRTADVPGRSVFFSPVLIEPR